MKRKSKLFGRRRSLRLGKKHSRQTCSVGFTKKCVRLGNITLGCLRRPVHTFPMWHELVLMALMVIAYFLLKNFFTVSFAPIVGENPLRDPMLVLEPFMFIVFALLLLQYVWKGAMLGLIISLLLALSSLCFIIAIVTLMTVQALDVFALFAIILVPIFIFGVTVSMGKKYQSCLSC